MKKLKDVMTRSIQTVATDARLDEIAREMKRHDTGSIPVCAGRKLRGIVTDRDIVLRAVTEGCDLAKYRAEDVMSRDVEWCYENESVLDAARVMQDRKIRRLIVLDKKQNLVGVISLGDLASKTLKDVSTDHGKLLGRSAIAGSMIAGVALAGWGAYRLTQRSRVFDRLRESFLERSERKAA